MGRDRGWGRRTGGRRLFVMSEVSLTEPRGGFGEWSERLRAGSGGRREGEVENGLVGCRKGLDFVQKGQGKPLGIQVCKCACVGKCACVSVTFSLDILLILFLRRTPANPDLSSCPSRNLLPSHTATPRLHGPLLLTAQAAPIPGLLPAVL